MYQQDRGYRTNEPIGKAFTNSCLGKIVILGVFLLIALFVAYFTTPTQKEMLAEIDDSIIECLQGEYGREFCLHLVPRKVDTSIILKIPIYTRGDVHPVVSSNHDLLALLVQFEEVLLALHFFDLELLRCTSINSFQQIVNRICPQLHRKQNRDTEPVVGSITPLILVTVPSRP